jgi:hypothetical protein
MAASVVWVGMSLGWFLLRTGDSWGVHVDAVNLIETALAVGAGAGMKATATQAVQDAYAGLKALVLGRVAKQPTGELTVAEHAKDPETWSAPLTKALRSAGADQDAKLIDAAQQLLQLVDPAGANAGAYVITATGDRSVATAHARDIYTGNVHR